MDFEGIIRWESESDRWTSVGLALALNCLVPASQTLLFLDPRPLVERLGEEFFRQLPERPGVYLMQDAAEVVLYVGKAKSLRQRLGHYRVANPDRMGRRHLRLLRQVVRIELQECADEMAALAREAELLRALKPKFNRAGVWPATPRFLVWRWAGQTLELAITETPAIGWQGFGPFGSGVVYLRAALVRLLWYALNPVSGSTDHAARMVAWTNGSDRDHCSKSKWSGFGFDEVVCGRYRRVCRLDRRADKFIGPRLRFGNAGCRSGNGDPFYAGQGTSHPAFRYTRPKRWSHKEGTRSDAPFSG